MDVEGQGAVTHIWITTEPKNYRDLILRMYWDGEEAPSVEVPLGDFFGCPFASRLKLLSIPINVNPTGGMNCYLPMPFRRGARITLKTAGRSPFPTFSTPSAGKSIRWRRRKGISMPSSAAPTPCPMGRTM